MTLISASSGTRCSTMHGTPSSATRGDELGRSRDDALALAVVAEAGRLDDRRAAGCRPSPSPATANGAVGTPSPARKRFSAMRSWAIATAAAGGATTTSVARRSSGVGRRVLELGGDDRATCGEVVERGRVVVGGDEVLVGDPPGRRVRVGVEHDRAVAHQAGGDERVAAELAAAEHADRRRRDDRRRTVGGSVADAAASRRSAR